MKQFYLGLVRPIQPSWEMAIFAVQLCICDSSHFESQAFPRVLSPPLSPFCVFAIVTISVVIESLRCCINSLSCHWRSSRPRLKQLLSIMVQRQQQIHLRNMEPSHIPQSPHRPKHQVPMTSNFVAENQHREHS